MPTEEVFTTPNKYTANGIVYSSKPLVYNSSLIDEFYIEFKDGKVINFDAKIGKDILKSIIEIENGNYLGEVALVDKLSPINQSNILFYETLYDENASCHIAVGRGFKECLNKVDNMTEEELERLGEFITYEYNLEASEKFKTWDIALAGIGYLHLTGEKYKIRITVPKSMLVTIVPELL